jgi:hypothetical protein
MSYSLLAHLFPRIKGSQEDVATYSLSYILEQSKLLNEAFTKLILRKMEITWQGPISYHCQDTDPEYGRPDIAGYNSGTLKILCEAKFYAGLTANQPVSYLRRLMGTADSGLVFICPKERIVSLWDKLTDLAEAEDLPGKKITDHCMDYSGTRMSIISWSEVLAELIRVAQGYKSEMESDLRQLEGFCSRVESDSFIPFNDDDLSVQMARNIDRYYNVVDQVHSVLKTHKELSPSTKGLRNAPRWQGYSAYIILNGKGISIDYLRNLWKDPATVTTPFWFHIADINDKGKWYSSDRMSRFIAAIDSRYIGSINGYQYIALVPRPYQILEELGENLANQIIDFLIRYENFEM